MLNQSNILPHISQEEILTNFLSTADLGAFNYLINLSNSYGGLSVHPSQSTIAIRTGYSLRSAHGAVKRLHELGLIVKKGRGFHQVCDYYINAKFLYDYNFRKKLSNLLPALKWFSKTLLGNVFSLSRKDCVPKNNKLFLNNRLTGIKVNIDYKEDSNMSEIMSRVEATLHLTETGKKRLSIFHDSVLEEVLEEYLKSSKGKGISNPFGWFFNLCKLKSETGSFRIRWKEHYDLKESMTLAQFDDVIDKSKAAAKKERKEIPVLSKEELYKQHLLERIKTYQYLYDCTQSEVTLKWIHMNKAILYEKFGEIV